MWVFLGLTKKLGSDQRFDLDADKLYKSFIHSQRQTHPDKFHQKGEGAVRQAEKINSLLNNAYGTLKDPIARSKYLLQLAGVEYGEEVPSPAAEFLIEVMEVREDIDDNQHNHEHLRKLQLDLLGRRTALEEQLALQFAKEPLTSDAVVDLTSRMIYLGKLLSTIHQRLPSS